MDIEKDPDSEPDETFFVQLSNNSANAALLNHTSAIGTILNDDGERLNDTGVTGCFDVSGGPKFCSDAVGSPGQDAQFGRDNGHGVVINGRGSNDGGDGDSGFSFTSTGGTCVQDNVTGLTWEIKSSDPSSIRYKGYTLFWFNSTGVNDGGDPGLDATTCSVFPDPRSAQQPGPLIMACDTEKYVQAVNQMNLCGFSDWRLPSVGELVSLLDFDPGFSDRFRIDIIFFTDLSGLDKNGNDLVSPGFWTSTQSRGGADAATVGFRFPAQWLIGSDSKSATRTSVRLVRGP